ncbi:hypothetical protein L596_009153 [Steinernema carpocapsae]|uniref:Uncharacterized protein n=1 Tax=Steinernema carpocapsae TaxID=34508 RepID=A0A4U5PFQ9_STECR|nr:hypothetical protein L596_009153 [Steinernema carpocapsae]
MIYLDRQEKATRKKTRETKKHRKPSKKRAKKESRKKKASKKSKSSKLHVNMDKILQSQRSNISSRSKRMTTSSLSSSAPKVTFASDVVFNGPKKEYHGSEAHWVAPDTSERDIDPSWEMKRQAALEASKKNEKLIVVGDSVTSDEPIEPTTVSTGFLTAYMMMVQSTQSSVCTTQTTSEEAFPVLNRYPVIKPSLDLTISPVSMVTNATQASTTVSTIGSACEAKKLQATLPLSVPAIPKDEAGKKPFEAQFLVVLENPKPEAEVKIHQAHPQLEPLPQAEAQKPKPEPEVKEQRTHPQFQPEPEKPKPEADKVPEGTLPHAEPEKPQLEEVKPQPQAMPEQPKPEADKKSQETLPQAEPQKSLELTTLNAEKSVVPHSQVPTEFKSLGANTAQSPTAGAIMSPSLSVASVPPTSLISPTISVGSSAVDPSMISLTRYPSSASVVSSANTNTGFSIPDLQTSISTTSIDSKVFTEATQQTSMADSLAGTATPTASAVEPKPEADKKAPEIQSQPETQKPEEPPKQP